MAKPIILCDMDGVVADLMTPLLARYNKEFDDSLTQECLTAWNVEQFCKPSARGRVSQLFNEEGMFYSAPVIPGAQEGILLMQELGFDVFFCTTPPVRSRFAVKEKAKWVDKHFPGVGAKKIIYTHHKGMVRGAALIDDKPENFNGFMGVRILFSQPWNKDFVLPRGESWLRISGWERRAFDSLS